MILAQVVFGLIPAFVMSILAMFVPIIGASWEVIFFVGAVLGTAGLCCAVFGYDPSSAKWVLLLLVIGELAMLKPLVLVLLSSMSRPMDIGILAVLGLMLGPVVIGAIHVFASAKQIVSKRA